LNFHCHIRAQRLEINKKWLLLLLNVSKFTVYLLPRPRHPSGLDFLYVFPQLHSDSHTQYDSPGRVIGPSQDPLPDHAQHSEEAEIHHPGGIRN